MDYDVSNHPANSTLHSLPSDSPPDGSVNKPSVRLDFRTDVGADNRFSGKEMKQDLKATSSVKVGLGWKF